MVPVIAGADDGNAAAFADPVTEDLEDAEALGADEGFGADDGNDEATLTVLFAELFGGDFGMTVGADADQRIGFEDGVLFRNAVDGGGGNVYDPRSGSRNF